ncbi:hypothetical protein EYF80_001672 [Liparis tanakae]|uniref:Uncharacterized protein n=1 Tax=Liparis tanakae TaxID=230148 RepID=A0A4Z2JDK0_9TELE|nr:hypothetical protein EYF80_001672 [Liparis tanakae]
MEEAEEDAGKELKKSSAECTRAGLDTAELSLLSGTHPPPLDTAALGAGASNSGSLLIGPSRGTESTPMYRIPCYFAGTMEQHATLQPSGDRSTHLAEEQ